MTQRKPTEMKRAIFPRVEVYNSRLYIQATKRGKWKKVAPKTALYLADRMKRCAKHVLSMQ
jgi:phage terminase large subunit-like protein